MVENCPFGCTGCSCHINPPCPHCTNHTLEDEEETAMTYKEMQLSEAAKTNHLRLDVPAIEAPPNRPKENILHEADRITSTDRRAEYGSAKQSFGTIASLWSTVLGVPVTPMQVGLCMIQLKVARQMNGHKRDSLVDIAGYARTCEMLADSDHG